MVAHFDPVGARGVGEGLDIIVHACAGGHRAEGAAFGEPHFAAPVEADAVEVALPGRHLGREVVCLLPAHSGEGRHLPRSPGDGAHEAAVDIVKVEVHVAGVGLLPHDEMPAVVEERDGAFVGPLDVAGRALVVDHPLRAVLFAEDDLEMVLPPVETVKPEPSVGRPADAGNVLVRLRTRLDPGRGAVRKVIEVERDDRIGFARLGVFERKGLVVEGSVVTHHLEQRHPPLVEAQEGQLPSVG